MLHRIPSQTDSPNWDQLSLVADTHRQERTPAEPVGHGANRGEPENRKRPKVPRSAISLNLDP